MGESLKPYRYQALQSTYSFRLLELQPGHENDPLVGRLLEVKLPSLLNDAEPPSFIAISYVWGAPKSLHLLECDGNVLHITVNLRDALRRVRHKSWKRYIWADAICINQEDVKERKTQVAQMRNIYHAATTVAVYLRPEESQDATLVEEQEWLATWLGRLSYALEGDPDPTRQRTIVDRECRQICRRALSRVPLLVRLYDNPWFSRIWVIQEVAESWDAQVFFWNRWVTWQAVVGVAKWVATSDQVDQMLEYCKTNGLRNCIFMEKSKFLKSDSPILALLQSTREFQSTDPRDKVYAVLHMPLRRQRAYTRFLILGPAGYATFAIQAGILLFHWSVMLELGPFESRFWIMFAMLAYLVRQLRFNVLAWSIMDDFWRRFVRFCQQAENLVLSSGLQITDTMSGLLSMAADYSLTTPTVYKLVANRLIERSSSLDILAYVDHGSNLNTSSIYPSWVPRWDIGMGGVSVIAAQHRQQYQAAKNTRHSSSPPSLADSIGYGIDAPHADQLRVEGLRLSIVCSTWQPISVEHSIAHDSIMAHHSQPLRRQLTESSRAKRMAIVKTLRAGGFSTLLAQPASAPALRTNASNLIQGSNPSPANTRRLFYTANGFVGIGPQAMRVGDVICVLFGASVPFVLRVTETDGMYRLIGECFVYGIMQGELVDNWRAGKLRKEVYVLC